MTIVSIVLTGIEESRPFIRVDNIEEVVFGNNSDFRIAGPITRYLVFNCGDLKIPCDQDTFDRIVTYCKSSQQKRTESVTEGAEVFGGDLPPIPEDTDPVAEDNESEDTTPDNWSGVEDEGEDGVGQV